MSKTYQTHSKTKSAQIGSFQCKSQHAINLKCSAQNLEEIRVSGTTWHNMAQPLSNPVALVGQSPGEQPGDTGETRQREEPPGPQAQEKQRLVISAEYLPTINALEIS